jgi:hypothetical protein
MWDIIMMNLLYLPVTPLPKGNDGDGQVQEI